MIHYKNIKEMIESPEYKKYIKLIRLGIKKGILEAYPPLPEEVECQKQL